MSEGSRRFTGREVAAVLIGRLPKSKRALDLVVHPACRCPTLRISPKRWESPQTRFRKPWLAWTLLSQRSEKRFQRLAADLSREAYNASKTGDST